jgi:predicted enzyme related to lactoylglutathione lyase
VANTFDWIEIRARDAEETARFYENVFGWRMTEKATADGTAVWLFDTGGEPRIENLRRGGIWSRPSDESLGVVVYIVVEDIEATLEKVIALGGEVVGPKTPQGSAYRAYFADSSGNILGLWEEHSAG